LTGLLEEDLLEKWLLVERNVPLESGGVIGVDLRNGWFVVLLAKRVPESLAVRAAPRSRL